MKHTYKLALLSLCAFAQEMNAAGAFARLRAHAGKQATALRTLIGARAFGQTAATSRLAQPTTATARSVMPLATSSRTFPLQAFRTFSSDSGNNRQNISKNWSFPIITAALGYFGYETRTKEEIIREVTCDTIKKFDLQLAESKFLTIPPRMYLGYNTLESNILCEMNNYKTTTPLESINKDEIIAKEVLHQFYKDGVFSPQKNTALSVGKITLLCDITMNRNKTIAMAAEFLLILTLNDLINSKDFHNPDLNEYFKNITGLREIEDLFLHSLRFINKFYAEKIAKQVLTSPNINNSLTTDSFKKELEKYANGQGEFQR